MFKLQGLSNGAHMNMKFPLFLTSALCLTQGCAVAAGLTQGIIADASATQPRVADPFNRTQRDPVAGGFGTGRPAMPVPANMPLPIEANPWRRFSTPGLNPNAANAILGGVANVVLLGCALDELYGARSSACSGRADGIRIAGPPNKPIVHAVRR
jgi:hypothetical protein